MGTVSVMNATGFAGVSECFEILEVREGADWTEVKRAYYRLARLYHPDMNPDYRDEERFKKISQAFQILEGHFRENPKTEPELTVWGEFSNSEAKTEEEVFDAPAPESGFRIKLENGLRQSFDFLKEMERKALMLDVVTSVRVDSRTAQKGGTVRVRIASGSFQVKVPAGMQEEQVMRIPGKGERGLLNTQRGDLILRIQIQKPQTPFPTGEDFYYPVTVTREELSNRSLRTLETHEGPIRYTLPVTTRTGQTFTLKARDFSGQTKPINHIIVVEVVPE